MALRQVSDRAQLSFGLAPHHDAVKSTSTGCLPEPWTTCVSHALSLVIVTTWGFSGLAAAL